MTTKEGPKMSDSTKIVVELPENWVAYITQFAQAIGKSVEETTKILNGLVGSPGDEAIALLQDEKYTPFDDIKSYVSSDVPVARLRQAVAGLRKPVSPEASATSGMSSVAMFDVLPSVPNDASWLAGLKTGGVLKPNRDTVVGAVSAALAHRVGLYDLLDKIIEAMEAHADSLDEPVPAEYFSVERALTERSYAELFSAIPGATGKYTTQERKDALIGKLEQYLWKSLLSFQEQLKGWVEAWQQNTSNPAVVMSAISALLGGGGISPTSMVQIPPTDSLRDSAEGVISSINRIFSGVGGMVAMVLAYDAQQIRLALENPLLPAQIGATNRDQMLRRLGAAVSSDHPRLEMNLRRYTLGIIELPNVTPGQTEIVYITALFHLGSQIPWEKLMPKSDDVVLPPLHGKPGKSKEFKPF